MKYKKPGALFEAARAVGKAVKAGKKVVKKPLATLRQIGTSRFPMTVKNKIKHKAQRALKGGFSAFARLRKGGKVAYKGVKCKRAHKHGKGC